MKIKTSELTGAALDWAVIIALGWGEAYAMYGFALGDFDCTYSPSTDWSQGGPIIDSEKVSINYDTDYEYDTKYKRGERWVATTPSMYVAFGRGTTPLIAAMRCFVAIKLGEEVDVPDELI